MKSVRLILLLLLIPFVVFPQQFPEKPVPPKLVNDFTQTLSSQEIDALEQKLVAYNDSTSTQVAIVMIHSLDGYPVDDYAIQLAERWGIGQKGRDNGILIFVAKDDRKIFIPTGYGMEGVMPDGLVKRIIENDMKPYFKQNNFYEGFNKATDSIFRLAAGEYTADEQAQKNPMPSLLVILGILFVIVLFIVIQVKSVKSYANVNSIGFWTAWMLINQARRSHHGTWGGFSGGGGGSSGGGGFGGFGGGSFGGGGAGGSW